MSVSQGPSGRIVRMQGQNEAFSSVLEISEKLYIDNITIWLTKQYVNNGKSKKHDNL